LLIFIYDVFKKFKINRILLLMDENNLNIISEELTQERKLYSDLANALPSGIYRLRVFNEKSLNAKNWASTIDAPYVAEFVNERFCQILNIEWHDFEVNPGIIYDLIYEEDRADFVRLNVEANLKITPFIWEGRVINKDELLWIQFVSIPRVLANRDIIWTGTLNDISERKKVEQLILSQNQELKKLNAEKDKFFSIIAHDLKSPVCSIIGFSEHLIEMVEDKNYEQIKEFAGIILLSTNRALSLLTNLLEWSQSQSGRMAINPEYFELNSVIIEVELLLNSNAEQKLINIENTLETEVWINADKRMIGSVLRNLISNALKFTMPGGKITISTMLKEDELVFSVADTGVGIKKERLEKLFSISESYSTQGTQNEKGTGLGLLLSKEFVEKHNGKIWAESNVGVGTVFYVSLPLSAGNI
jgi:signal transduction histidine kinase